MLAPAVSQLQLDVITWVCLCQVPVRHGSPWELLLPRGALCQAAQAEQVIPACKGSCTCWFGKKRALCLLFYFVCKQRHGFWFFCDVKWHLLFSFWRAFDFSQNDLLKVLRVRFIYSKLYIQKATLSSVLSSTLHTALQNNHSNSGLVIYIISFRYCKNLLMEFIETVRFLF